MKSAFAFVLVTAASLFISSNSAGAEKATAFQVAMEKCEVAKSWELLTVGIIGDMLYGPKGGKLTVEAKRRANCILRWTKEREPQAMLKFGGVNAKMWKTD